MVNEKPAVIITARGFSRRIIVTLPAQEK